MTRNLFKGILENDVALVEKSINWGADVNQERFPYPWCNFFETNDTPLTLACELGHEEIVLTLLQHGADVNLQESWGGDYPLLAALRYRKENRFHLAMLLIEHGADINVAAEQGRRSPLWCSVKIYDTDSCDTIESGFTLFQFILDNLSVPPTSDDLIALRDYADALRNQNVVEYLTEHHFVG